MADGKTDGTRQWQVGNLGRTDGTILGAPLQVGDLDSADGTLRVGPLRVHPFRVPGTLPVPALLSLVDLVTGSCRSHERISS